MTRVRKAFTTSGCPHCRIVLTPIEEISNKLSIGKRISNIDSYGWEKFKMANHPIMHKLSFDSYPTLIADGVKVKGFLTKNQTRAFLDGFFEGDKIVPEEVKWMRE